MDLSVQITSWIKYLDQLIIMGDINEYIYIHKIRSYLSNLGLGELIIGKDSSVGPATTISNKKLKEVYGIWGSQRLYITERGYLPFYMVPKIISRAHMDKIISRSGIWEQKPTFQIPIGHKNWTLSHQGTKEVYI